MRKVTAHNVFPLFKVFHVNILLNLENTLCPYYADGETEAYTSLTAEGRRLGFIMIVNGIN